MELFYVPSKALCTEKRPVVTAESLEGLVSGWHMSEGFKATQADHGTLLANDLPWQSKWYLKFDPLKPAGELGIEQYWSYEAPKLTTFAESSDYIAPDQAEIAQLGKLSASNLKNMANVVLSGTTHDSLKSAAYRREAYKADSEADRTSVFSTQLRMPTNESGQEKLSMLEKFTMEASTDKVKLPHARKH